jgi:hypothetical protein
MNNRLNEADRVALYQFLDDNFRDFDSGCRTLDEVTDEVAAAFSIQHSRGWDAMIGYMQSQSMERDEAAYWRRLEMFHGVSKPTS